MKLMSSLYTIQSRQAQGTAISFDLLLHADNPIYQAHFPGEPITPGVCVIQIAKELLEIVYDRPLVVRAIKNVKFLAVISPVTNPQIRYTIDGLQETTDGVKAVVVVTADDRVMTHISFTVSNL